MISPFPAPIVARFPVEPTSLIFEPTWSVPEK
jgi:hypothetical protein